MISLPRRIYRKLPTHVREKIKTWVLPEILSIARHHSYQIEKDSLKHEIQSAAQKFETSSYQVPVLFELLELAKITSIRGTRVCEIGGDGKFGIAKLWHELSGNPVTVTNPCPDTDFSVSELEDMGITLHRLPFEESPLETNSFEIIYGCAVLEHIIPMHKFFESVFDKLSPGGWVILHGCPLWYSHIGHHTYKRIDGLQYDMGQPDCPVPAFGHLYMSDEEMRTYLMEEKNVSSAHADILCEDMYRFKHINRLSISQICEAASIPPWQEFHFKTELDYTAYLLKDFLAEKGIAMKDVQRSLLYFAAKKPERV